MCADLDERAAITIRMLAADGVEAARSAHPGLPMGMATAAWVPWSRELRFDPSDPHWPDRDRFVPSAGHGSMLLFALLHLSGYGLPLDELRRFRQWGSATPGHPEFGHTPGVETTTGPLGQGIATATGLALAERMTAAGCNVAGEEPVVDNRTFVLCSDGDLMEGVSGEAASLAGHLELGRLVVLYDDNGITIDGSTSLAFSEDVLARFAACGWHTNGVDDAEDVAALEVALKEAVAETDRPSLIAVRSTIGYGAPPRRGRQPATVHRWAPTSWWRPRPGSAGRRSRSTFPATCRRRSPAWRPRAGRAAPPGKAGGRRGRRVTRSWPRSGSGGGPRSQPLRCFRPRGGRPGRAGLLARRGHGCGASAARPLGCERSSMYSLTSTALEMVAAPKGILAADESNATITKRFARLGIESTADSRRAYREMLLTTPGLADHTSGVILYDETFHQRAGDGRLFPSLLDDLGVLPGIKVDTGAKPLAGCPEETVTEGLDGLRDRLEAYARLGARFAKWRAVISIGEGLPSRACLSANAHALARYAALCQEAGMVPIVEPEVLMDGSHPLGRTAAVTEETLRTVFAALADQDVELEGIVLKPNMVVPGKDARRRATEAEVAAATLTCLRRSVPAAVPGIAFLSGGQSPDEATDHLHAMADLGPHPWELTFSFGRALQDPAMAAWSGSDVLAGQTALAERLRRTAAARSATPHLADEPLLEAVVL